jgi:hypothetical protein
MGELWVLMLLLIAIAYVVAFSRKGNVRMAMSASQREIHTPADPATVAECIKRLGPPYTVDDHADGIIVLSSPVTFFSWGFFYPVLIQPEGSGSKIVVGVKSKVFQLGPIVMRAHSQCAEAIERALSIPSARVA